MSRSRYNWWPFALNMIYDYLARAQEYRELHRQKITADLSGMPGGGGDPRTVERIAARQLPFQEQKEYEAVHRALERTKRMPNGPDRIRVVGMTLLRSTHTIPGAAESLHIAERAVRRYRYQFILLVGCTYGLISEEVYLEEVKKDYGNQKTDSHGAGTVL